MFRLALLLVCVFELTFSSAQDAPNAQSSQVVPGWIILDAKKDTAVPDIVLLDSLALAINRRCKDTPERWVWPPQDGAKITVILDQLSIKLPKGWTSGTKGIQLGKPFNLIYRSNSLFRFSLKYVVGFTKFSNGVYALELCKT
jgi:hypothetical protein